MSEFGLESAVSTPNLLAPGEPPPYTRVNWDGAAPVLLICDHASRRIPEALNGLGVDRSVRVQHIGWDIGAAELTRGLAQRLGGRAVLSGYSRLVVDCNRPLKDPSSIPVESGGHVIPGNLGIKPGDAEARVEACFWPYHGAIENAVAEFADAGTVPAIISIHSFTPELHGVSRRWHVGILWDRDSRLPRPVMAALAADSAIVVGDNQPYSANYPQAYTIPVHAVARGLPHILVEVRQDLIDTASGVESWTERLATALTEPLADPDLYRVANLGE